jgi:predicted 2-oxoglutarate/Fe(II)-dependent dioxygenase YbiX
VLLIRPGFISQSISDELIAAFRQIDKNWVSGDSHVRRWPYRTAISAVLLKEAGIRGLDERLSKVRQQAADAVCEFYGLSDATYIDYTLMTEMKVGDSVPMHADNQEYSDKGEWLPNHTHYHHCTANLYLNTCDVDYEGGLLRFSSIQEEVVPQKGLLVGFLSGREYQHEVTPIKNGCRYNISVWVTLDPARAECWDYSDIQTQNQLGG